MINQHLCAIEDFGQQSAEFLGVFDADLTRLHTLRPFGSDGIRKAQIMGSRIYAIAHGRKAVQDGTPIVLIDAASGRELARDRSFVLPGQTVFLPQNRMIALVGGLTEVEFRDADTLAHIWTCRPRAVIDPSRQVDPVPNDLHVAQAPKTATKPHGELAEGPDGLVRMPMTSPHMTGLFEIDPQARSFRVVPLDPGAQDRGFNGGFCSISPDGHWGIRENIDLRVTPYGQLTSKHGKWVLVARLFELWDLPAGRKHADLTPAPQPVMIHNRVQDDAQAYVAWLHAGGRGRGIFRRAPKWPLPGHEANPHKIRKDLTGNRLRFYWESDSTGVWMIRHYAMMRADLDGLTGPLIFSDHGLGDAQRAVLADRPAGIDLGVGEAYPHGPGCKLIHSITKPAPDTVRFDFYGSIMDLPLPYGPSDVAGPVRTRPKLTARDIAEMLPALVPVNGWGQDAVDTALADLTTRISKGLENLVSGNGLTIMFKQRNSFLDEWTFFDKLQDKGLINASALRSLLTAFCDAQGDRQWYFASDEARAAGPLSGALAALARNDDACHDILRRYCLLRDGEYESFSRDTVLLGFINRQTPMDIQTLRLAVFYVLLRDQDGRFTVEDGKAVYPWAELGIPDAARALMTPDAFVTLLRDEAAQWPDNTKAAEHVIAGLSDALDPATPWDAQLLTALRS